MYEIARWEHLGAIYSIAFSPDGNTLAAGGASAILHVWDVVSGEVLRTIRTDDQIYTVALGPVGSVLAAGTEGGMVHLWRRNDFDNFRDREYGEYVNSIACNRSGRLLAVGCQDGSLSLWGIGRHPFVHMDLGEQPCHSVSFNRTGRLLAVGWQDGTVNVWDVAGERVCRSNLDLVDAGGAWQVAFGPNGKSVAILGFDAILIWDWSRRRQRTSILEFGDHNPGGIAWHPDGKLLASAGHDESIRLWDVATGTVLHELKGHKGLIHSVAFHPDGEILASGSEDGTVRLWELAPLPPPGSPDPDYTPPPDADDNDRRIYADWLEENRYYLAATILRRSVGKKK